MLVGSSIIVIVNWFTKILFISIATGVKDNSDTYLIELPTWSKSVTAAGTKISLIHEANQFKDTLYVLGPTTEPIKVVVSCFVFEAPWVYESLRVMGLCCSETFWLTLVIKYY